MNNFYKSSKPCPHVHIHVRPRYKNPVVFNGKAYMDYHFGHHYSRGNVEQICSKDDIQTLNTEIK